MIALLAAALLAATPAPAPASVSRVPDERLVDQDGRPLRVVSDLLAGRTVAVSFVFTTCTTICPPMTAIFSRLQDELGPRLGKDVALLSITLDPDTDTPERLRKFARPYARRAGWSFLTGPREEVRAVARALGGWQDEKMVHQPVVLVGNHDAGVWTLVDGFARPRAMADEIARVQALAAAKASR
jgi:protein SCO1/2